MNTNEKSDSHIELSTVYFYEGNAPRVIALKDCGLVTKSPISGAFSALYGYQSKQEGFMAARAYADKNRLHFTVIDFLVKLDHKQNQLMMKPEDLSHHDFVTFQRLSRSTMDQLQNIFKTHLEQQGVNPDTVDLSKPHLLVMQRPELIASLINEPGWDHLKVIAYPANLPISEKPLTVATIPFRHWGTIKEAKCRLNPNILITLDPPRHHDQSSPLGPSTPKDRDHNLRPR